VTCDAQSFYTMESRIYCHVEEAKEDQVSTSKTANLVISMLKPYEGFNYKIAMDNYYTSPELFEALKQRKIGAVGTLRLYRAKFDYP